MWVGLSLLALEVLLLFSLATVAILLVVNEHQRQHINALMDSYVQLGLQKGYFERKGKYIRDDELRLYRMLLNLFSDRYAVFPQVRICDLIDVKSGNRDHDNLYSAIGTKSLDFVLMTKDALEPVLAIELNGGYHMFNYRKNKDAAKEALLGFAEIPLLSIEKKSLSSLNEVKRAIEDKIAPKD